MPGRARITALSAVFLAALLLPGPAEAKKKRKPVAPPVVTATASTTTTTDGQVASATATCPPGTIALGGGFDSQTSTFEGETSDLNFITESRRADAASWTVTGARQDSESAGPDLLLTATVHCRAPRAVAAATKKKKAGKSGGRKGKKKRKKVPVLTIEEVSSTGPLAVEGVETAATAQCPAGRTVVSGGFSTSPLPTLVGPPSFALLAGSHPAGPTGWTSFAENRGGTPRSITSHAYCLAGAPAPAQVSLPTPLPGLSTGTTALSPVCGARSVAGGGFRMPPPEFPAYIPFVISSISAGTQWNVIAGNSGPNPGTVAAFASCL